MNTFLPYPNLAASAYCLDKLRLGKQRVEVSMILRALGVSVGGYTSPDSHWRHHPATKMWKGYEVALAGYGVFCCEEWRRRGFVDNLGEQFLGVIEDIGPEDNEIVMPPWMGWIPFHLSHQSNLVRKNPLHYGPLFPEVPTNLPYIWPTPELHASLMMGYSQGIEAIERKH